MQLNSHSSTFSFVTKITTNNLYIPPYCVCKLYKNDKKNHPEIILKCEMRNIVVAILSHKTPTVSSQSVTLPTQFVYTSIRFLHISEWQF